MASLRVPFERNSIQELYRKINKGVISKIPSRYSPELFTMIKICLTKDPKKRPSVDELLENDIVLSKMKAGGIELVEQSDFPVDLMNTIKLPRNMDQLISRLPQKRYGKSSRASSAGPGKYQSERSSSRDKNPKPVYNFKKKDRV